MRIRKTIEYDYYINNHELKEVTEQLDLAILISNDLKHIAKMTKNQRLGLIRRCFTNHSVLVISPLCRAIVTMLDLLWKITVQHRAPWSPWLT